MHEEVQSTLIKFVVGKPEATENGFPSFFLLDAMSHGLRLCDKDFFCWTCIMIVVQSCSLACATAASDSQVSQQATYLSILAQYQSITQPSLCSGVTRCISITCPAQHDFFYPNTSTLLPSKHIISLLIGFCRGELIILCSHWRPCPWYLWIRVGTDKLKVFYPIDLFCVGPSLSMQRAYNGLVLFTPPMKLQTRPLLTLIWLVVWQFCQLGKWLHEYSMGLLVYTGVIMTKYYTLANYVLKWTLGNKSIQPGEIYKFETQTWMRMYTQSPNKSVDNQDERHLYKFH